MDPQRGFDFVGFVFGWWQRSGKREETSEELLQFPASLTQDQLAFPHWFGVRQRKKSEK